MKITLQHNLEKLRTEAIDRIDTTISLYRQGLVTGGSLQLDVYRKKLQEAKDIIENNSTKCIFLKTEAKQRDLSLLEMANLIIQKDKEYTLKLAEIEGFKVEAIRNVTNANTPEEIEIAANVNIPLYEKRRLADR